jgi:type IV pilus assembly protein PilA
METFLRLKAKTNQQGFSLVELMVVVAIIGILAALAVPRFQMFQAKARQTEAKNNLSHIYTLQESFYGDNEKYGNVAATGAEGACPGDTGADNIGFRVTPCTGGKVRYTYTSAPSGAGWTATARAAAGKIVPGCPIADQWNIDQDKTLEPKKGANAIQDCSK